MDKYQIGSIYTNKRNKIDYKIVEKEEENSIVPELAGKLRLIQLPETEGAESHWIKLKTLKKTYSLKAEPKIVEEETQAFKETEARAFVKAAKVLLSISPYPTYTASITGFRTKEDAQAYIKDAKTTLPKTSHFQVEPANKPLVQQGFPWQVREWRYIEQ